MIPRRQFMKVNISVVQHWPFDMTCYHWLKTLFRQVTR